MNKFFITTETEENGGSCRGCVFDFADIDCDMLCPGPEDILIMTKTEQTPTWQDQPTEDGYYWLSDKNGISFVDVLDIEDGFVEYGCMVLHLGTDQDSSVCNIIGKWYGPIAPPKED